MGTSAVLPSPKMTEMVSRRLGVGGASVGVLSAVVPLAGGSGWSTAARIAFRAIRAPPGALAVLTPVVGRDTAATLGPLAGGLRARAAKAASRATCAGGGGGGGGRALRCLGGCGGGDESHSAFLRRSASDRCTVVPGLGGLGRCRGSTGPGVSSSPRSERSPKSSRMVVSSVPMVRAGRVLTIWGGALPYIGRWSAAAARDYAASPSLRSRDAARWWGGSSMPQR